MTGVVSQIRWNCGQRERAIRKRAEENWRLNSVILNGFASYLAGGVCEARWGEGIAGWTSWKVGVWRESNLFYLIYRSRRQVGRQVGRNESGNRAKTNGNLRPENVSWRRADGPERWLEAQGKQVKQNIETRNMKQEWPVTNVSLADELVEKRCWRWA